MIFKRIFKDKILYVRHSQLVTDPFPRREDRERTSVHEAYMMGYEKAYEELIAKLDHIEIEEDKK